MRMALIKNVMLVAASLVLSVASAELILNAFVPSPPNTMGLLVLRDSSYYQQDSELGWLPKPNVSGEHIVEGSFRTSIDTNSLGLRDREHSIERTTGTSRIVVIGDSFTWGWGVSNGESFPDLLEEDLKDTEVINLGVTAYGLRQEIAYFKRLGVRFRPDTLIVAFCQNDLDPAVVPRMDTPRSIEERTAHDLPLGDSSFSRVKKTFFNRSAVYRLLINAISHNRALVKLAVRVGIKESLAGIGDLDVNIAPSLKSHSQLEEMWIRIESELRELQSYTSDRGIRLILAMVPAEQSVDRYALERTIAYSEFEVTDFDLDRPYRRMEDVGRRIGLEVFNPLEKFRSAHEAGVKLYLRGDMHFSVAGHELFSEELASYLTATD